MKPNSINLSNIKPPNLLGEVLVRPKKPQIFKLQATLERELISKAQEIFSKYGLGIPTADNEHGKNKLLDRLFTLTLPYVKAKHNKYFEAFEEVKRETNDDFQMEILKDRKQVILYVPLYKSHKIDDFPRLIISEVKPPQEIQPGKHNDVLPPIWCHKSTG
ncbi:MAG: hypothetical protein HYR97_03570 [Candidatus Melainabacteria bacterium]|nr:hypothetical protein [Candidatus Melainabacteria bacterium]